MCSVAFFPNICIFQDLFNGQVRAIGREDSGLYILSENSQPVRISDEVVLAAKELSVIIEHNTNEDIDLWHWNWSLMWTQCYRSSLHLSEPNLIS